MAHSAKYVPVIAVSWQGVCQSRSVTAKSSSVVWTICVPAAAAQEQMTSLR